MKSPLQHWLLPHKGNRHRPLLIQSRGFLTVSMVVALWYLILLAALHIPQLHNILGYSTQITVPQVLTAVNAKREAAGLQPLQLDEKLSAAARIKAEDMLAKSYWAHTSPEGLEPWDFIARTGYRYSIAGENLARNFTQTPTMVEAWIESPTHRANLLGEEYQHTGIAVLQGEMDGVTTTLVVQMFGKPDTGLLAEADRYSASPQPGFEPYAANDTEEGEQLLGTNIFNPDSSHPLFSPLSLYRYGMMGVLIFLIGVLIHDLRLEKIHRQKRHAGRNIAHIVVIIAVIITLALVQTGKLL